MTTLRGSLLLGVALLFGFVSFAQPQQQPNIVYILVDNWGWGDISVQGNTFPTPRIDALAAEGLRLTNFNVQNQCTPTRSALHTGRLPIRSGTQKVAAPGEPDGMAPWEYTVAELLSDAGYATALYGKWHLGSKPGRMPNDQGYDEWWGINEGWSARETRVKFPDKSRGIPSAIDTAAMPGTAPTDSFRRSSRATAFASDPSPSSGR